MPTLASTLQVVFAVVVAFYPTPASTQDQPIDAWIERQMPEKQIPGLGLLILRGGEMVKMAGYGVANLEHDVPVSSVTLFQSGSVGKQFTAAAILLLVEEGRLELDSPAIRYLPELPASWNGITLRHLLSHTSGIPDYGPPLIDYQRDYTDSELLDIFSRMPLHFQPGAEWSYSNTGYVLLGMIIGRVTGAHWSEFVHSRIFEPLKMRTARLISEADLIPNRAAGYRVVEGVLKNQEWVSPTFSQTADGALYLGLSDWAKWDAALYGDGLLSAMSKREMWTPVLLNDGSRASYGFGWFINDERRPHSLEHSGSWQGFTAHLARFPEDSITVVILTNSASANPTPIAHGVAGMYRPSLQPVARVAMALSRGELDAYAGRYTLPTGDTVQISRANEGLVVDGWGPPGVVYRPDMDTTFFLGGDERTLTFRTDTGSRHAMVAYLSRWPGMRERARRVPEAVN